MNTETKFADELRSAARTFPTLPASDRVARSDNLVRKLLAALTAGAGTYTLLPELFNASTSGTADEQASLYAAIGAFIFASIRNVQELCWSSTNPAAERLELAKGGAAGLMSGTAIASLMLPFTLVDGGVLLLTTTVGFLFAVAQARTKRAKQCPTCKQDGNCSQRICRYCYRIFWPPTVELNCSARGVLSWLEVAAFLQQRGLNYFDALLLLEHHGPDWGLLPNSGVFQVICKRFRDWIERSDDLLFASIGSGGANMSPAQRDKYLTDLGL